MTPPGLPVILKAGAAADVRVVDRALVALADGINYLAAQQAVRLLREPLAAPESPLDIQDLGQSVYADVVMVSGVDGQARVLADPQAPGASQPGTVTVWTVPGAAWLPGAVPPDTLDEAQVAALKAAVNQLVADLTETLHLVGGE